MPASADLDSIDRQLLAMLQKDGRRAVKDLAADLNVAPSTCAERMRGLLRRGVISGIHARPDLAELGRSEQALLGIRVRPHSRELRDGLVQAMLARPEALAVYHVSGNDDLLVHIAVPNTSAMRDFVLDRVTSRPEVVAVQSYLIFQEWRQAVIEPLGP
jgi:DNA-binding Lrp family transcriptional regulator